jgi:hypothetical protein
LSNKPLVEIPGKRWCLELRDLGRFATAAEVLDDAPRPLYALLHGDEGWAFVSAHYAETAVANFWSSRDYVAVLAQPAAVVVLNLTERRDDDRRSARARTEKLTGVRMPHLELTETAVAGVEHGALFALERSLLRLLAARELESQLFGLSKPLARGPRRIRRLLRQMREVLKRLLSPPRLLYRLGRSRSGRGTSPSPMRGRTFAARRPSQALRGRFPALLRVLYRGPQSRFYRDLLIVSRGGVSALDDLQVFMDERVGTTPLMDRLRHGAELVDIEFRDKRMMRLNWLVVLLTVLTAAIGVIDLIRKWS